MPQLQIFTEATLPSHLAWQRRAFERIVWEDVYVEDPDEPLTDPDDPDTRHFIVINHEALLSAATVIRAEVEADGVPYICYGLSTVLTYPAFRKRGYGRQVVEAANTYIRQQPDADLALLWTMWDLSDWYARSGWEPAHDLRTYDGDRDAMEPTEDDFAMLQFLSSRAQADRERILASKLYVGPFSW